MMRTTLRDRLHKHGYDWVIVPEHNPAYPFVNARQAGRLVFVSGIISMDADDRVIAGKVGEDLDIEAAAKAAGRCALGVVYAAGSIVPPDALMGVLDMTVFVNVAPKFDRLPLVANGASEVLLKLFGSDEGRHARAAIGVAELPLGAAVEIRPHCWSPEQAFRTRKKPVPHIRGTGFVNVKGPRLFFRGRLLGFHPTT
jgi:enamine deaminase RidA (YjgF/YER057c/UK114 family)